MCQPTFGCPLSGSLHTGVNWTPTKYKEAEIKRMKPIAESHRNQLKLTEIHWRQWKTRDGLGICRGGRAAALPPPANYEGLRREGMKPNYLTWIGIGDFKRFFLQTPHNSAMAKSSTRLISLVGTTWYKNMDIWFKHRDDVHIFSFYAWAVARCSTTTKTSYVSKGRLVKRGTTSQETYYP